VRPAPVDVALGIAANARDQSLRDRVSHRVEGLARPPGRRLVTARLER
jgi:hypothetical protein